MTDQPVVHKKRHPWDETIRTVLTALVLAVIFRSLAFEPFHIPSGSMKPTLLVGDYLFVSKFSYGYSRYSFPFGLPMFKGRVLEFHEPKRGDVVVFREPANPSVDFIKRIMGVPGDTVQVKEGIVYINGTPLKRKPLDDFPDHETTTDIHSVPQFAETLSSGKVIHILKEQRYGVADDTPVFVVPPHHYFMMGDNRDNSRDSRFSDVGFVPEENLVGKADLIFFSTTLPIDETGNWLNPVTWIKDMRFNRFFKHIE